VVVRTRRIELLSPEWRSGIEPINYIRVFLDRAHEYWRRNGPSSLKLRRAPCFALAWTAVLRSANGAKQDGGR
jgi:hypothetical protein